MNIKKIIKNVIYFLRSPSTFLPPDKKQKKLIKKLKSEISHIPEKADYKDNKMESEWQNSVDNLRHHILNDDPRKFLQWKEVSSTMVFSGSEHELSSLKKDNWPYWKEIIEDNYFGMPPLFKYCWGSSGNYIHLAYHFQKLLAEFNLKIDKLKTIIEFGGGYGAMALLSYRQGFKGRYLIFDLPEFLALQKYYLSSANETKLLPSNNSNISFFSKQEDLTNSLKDTPGIDLFIAMWSISESPLKLREELLENIFNLQEIKYVLIGFQKQFSDIDNYAYFKNFTNKYNNFSWKIEAISHLKNNYYLIGKNNKNDNY